MGRDNLDKREAEEVKVPDMKIVPPAYIEGAQLKKFNEISGRHAPQGRQEVFTADVETSQGTSSARPVVEAATNMLLETDDVDKSKAISRQAIVGVSTGSIRAQSELCLNITSRCKVSLKGDGDGGGNGESEF